MYMLVAGYLLININRGNILLGNIIVLLILIGFIGMIRASIPLGQLSRDIIITLMYFFCLVLLDTSSYPLTITSPIMNLIILITAMYYTNSIYLRIKLYIPKGI